jgi:general secretion pathway protein G
MCQESITTVGFRWISGARPPAITSRLGQKQTSTMHVRKYMVIKAMGSFRHMLSKPTHIKTERPLAIMAFTLIELLIVIAIIGTLAAIALSAYHIYIEKARIANAIADIRNLQSIIVLYEADSGQLPDTLGDIGQAAFLDPWGNPYEYRNYNTPKVKVRKNKKDKPLNTYFDLWSNGRDGDFGYPLTAKKSQDDVIRAYDGAYIGLGADYPYYSGN